MLKILEYISHKEYPLSMHKIEDPENYIILTHVEIITKYINTIIIKSELIEQIQAEILAFLFLNDPVIKHPIALLAIQNCTKEELEEIAKILDYLLEE